MKQFKNLVWLSATVSILAACNPLSGELETSDIESGFHPGYVQTSTSLAAMPVLVAGGRTLTLGFSLPTEMSSAKLEYSSDGGSTYSFVTSLQAYHTSYSWSVPSDNTVLARIRLTVTSNGTDQVLESTVFAIDSLAPAAPAVALSSGSPSANSHLAFTVSDCTDRSFIFVSESAAAPSDQASGWQACHTSAGSILYTVASGDGAKTLYVFAKDGAGNVSASATVSATLDTTAPALAFTASPTSISALKGGASFALAWTASETTTSIASLKLYYSTDGSSYDAGTVLSTSATTLSWTVPSDNTSNAKLKLVAIDSVGNTKEIETQAFMIDSGLPNVSITDLTGPYRGGTTVSVSLSASDAFSGINTFKIQYASDGSTFSDVATLSSTATSYSWAIPSDNTSNAKLKVIAADMSGNQKTATTAAFTVDTTAPSAPGVTLASANPTNSTAASATVASCSDRSKIFVSETSTAPAFDAAGWQSCSSAAGAITKTLSTGDALKTLYFFAQDAVGNVSGSSSLTVTLDQTAPAISLAGFSGGQILSGLLAQSISWTASDSSGSGLKTNSATLEVSSDSGSSWTEIANHQVTAGPYSWTAGSSANGTHYRLRVTVADNAGNTTSASSASDFTMDSEVPTLTSGQMTVNDAVSGGTTNSNYVQVSFKASDSATKITHFCLKYNDSAQPDSSAGCWVSVTALGQSAATSITATHYSFALGLGTSIYHVYGWVKDQAANISVLATVDGTDHVSIDYTAPQPPAITGVIGTSNATPATPPNQTDLTVNQGTDAYIQWKVTSTPSGTGPTPISLYYTTDNLSFDPIPGASALSDGANGCTPDANHTGCFKWANGSPANTFYAVRAVVTDSAGNTAAYTSSPVNSWPPINFLAGSTDPGTNGSASSATFISSAVDADGQSFVVTNSGVVYFRDKYRGILKVDPTNGNQVILIPMTTSAYVDGTVTGLTTGATVKTPVRLALDFQDRLLIQEANAIRRYDPTSNQISTLIGGASASSTATTSSASTTKILTGAPFTYSQQFPLFAVPDGRIYFGSANQGSAPAGTSSRIRVYTPTDSMVKSVNYSGTGTSEGSTESISSYSSVSIFFGFDPTSSDLDSTMMLLSRYGSASYRANFNPLTGAALPGSFMAIPPSGYQSVGITGMNGESYEFYGGRIALYDKSTRGWTTIAGGVGPGVTIDGQDAYNHQIDPQDIFVNASGKIFFFERGVIRAIDQNGKLLTLMGSGRSSGDGGNALNSRIGKVDDFKLWNNGVDSGDQVIFTDSSELRIRQFQVGGAMKTLAGNGSNAAASTSVAAKDTSLYTDTTHTAFLIQVNPLDGTLYSSSRSTGRISKLPQDTNTWVDLSGWGSSYTYITGDGKTGSQINSSGYTPSILGFDGSSVLAGWYRYSTTYVDSFFKLYGLSTSFTQSPFAGKAGNAGSGVCAENTLLTDCAIPSAGALGGSINQLFWDSYAHTWVGMLYGSNSAAGKKVFTMTEGGSIGYVADLPDYNYAFTRRHDATHDLIYYCSAGDRKLHRYDVALAATDAAHADSAYAWPIPSMQCGSQSLIYSPTRNSIIFAYQVNGLWGIAEYLNP